MRYGDVPGPRQSGPQVMHNGSPTEDTMDAQDYPIRHFEQIARFAAALRELPAQVEEHSYSYESFGSWVIVVRYKGRRMRVVFDGRDSDFSIQRSSSRTSPDKWGETCWRRVCESRDQFPESDIVDAIVKCATAG